MKREYLVTLPPGEAARLRAFDNKTDAEKPWPLGRNRTFRRKNTSTFVVREYVGSVLFGSAMVATIGTATLTEGDQVRVTVRTAALGIGYLLIGGGVLLVCLTPRDGIPALLMGAILMLAGWFLFARRPGLADDLDEVEKVLRAELRGHWQPVGADAAAGGPPRNGFETATRLTNFLHGDDVDSVPAAPAGWSVTNLLPARAVLNDGSLEVRRRGRVLARIPTDSISSLAQIPWKPDLVNQHPAVETWAVGHDGRPLAVIGWDTRIERQARDAGLPLRRFAHSIDRDVIAQVWAGRPAYPVAVHVEPTARR
ncbi:hypothetical protein [Nocardioides pantholopis]|uniref:hypothetical protein n=1 Tax=Nocardioides pantholopis TaxID=2483798 RepID=UPI000F076BDB|nr:hypothetical protein [Nocardioides pantholopis]